MSIHTEKIPEFNAETDAIMERNRAVPVSAETLAGLQAAADKICVEVDRLRDDLHTICGAFWRLDHNQCVAPPNMGDDELDEDAEHWIALARDVVERYRGRDQGAPMTLHMTDVKNFRAPRRITMSEPALWAFAALCFACGAGAAIALVVV